MLIIIIIIIIFIIIIIILMMLIVVVLMLTIVYSSLCVLRMYIFIRYEQLFFPYFRGSGRASARIINASLQLAFRLVRVPAGTTAALSGPEGEQWMGA